MVEDKTLVFRHKETGNEIHLVDTASNFTQIDDLRGDEDYEEVGGLAAIEKEQNAQEAEIVTEPTSKKSKE